MKASWGGWAIVVLVWGLTSPVSAQRLGFGANDPLDPNTGMGPLAFGGAVAMSRGGEWAIVGDRDSRTASIYRLGPNGWEHSEELLRQSQVGDLFGFSVALSADARLAFVGAPNYSNGSTTTGRVVAYFRNSVGEHFNDGGTVTMIGLDASSQAGWAVAIGTISNGSDWRFVIGAPGDIAPGGLRRGTLQAGQCLAETRQCIVGSVLSAGSTGDRLGEAVAISDNGFSRLFAGAPVANGGRGSVSFWRWNSGYIHSTITATGAQAGEHFGAALAYSSNQLLVGSPEFDANGAGAGAGHGRVQAFTETSGSFGAGVLVSNGPSNNARFGSSLGISSDGRRAVIGAWNDGYVAAYSRPGSSWIYGNRLNDAGSQLGRSVSMDAMGNQVVVGAPVGPTGAGYARVYEVGVAGGQGCSAASECLADFCAGGVCCSSSCNHGSQCESCATGTCLPRTGTVCQASRGPCEGDGVCASDGTCGARPSFSGMPCRPADPDLPCDAPEFCVGAAPGCPSDAPAPEGTVCNETPPGSDPECDPPDECDGTSMECEPNVLAPGAACGDDPSGDCDMQDRCVGGVCVDQVIVDLVTPCRAAQGICDVPDFCTGGHECTDDFVTDTANPCRPSAGPCDAPDFCNGDSADCGDALVASGLICRDSTEACDPAEQCDGQATSCPDDVNQCDGVDAGPPSDGGPITDEDASAGGADAGPVDVATGCSCRASAPSSRAPIAWLGALGAMLLRRRRRTHRFR